MTRGVKLWGVKIWTVINMVLWPEKDQIRPPIKLPTNVSTTLTCYILATGIPHHVSSNRGETREGETGVEPGGYRD